MHDFRFVNASLCGPKPALDGSWPCDVPFRTALGEGCDRPGEKNIQKVSRAGFSLGAGRAATLLLCLLLPLLASCTGRNRLTLNPDRSGKVELEIAYDLGAINEFQRAMKKEEIEIDPNNPVLPGLLAGMVMDFMEGIETWSYSEYGIQDQILRFKITGYFRDCNQIGLAPERVGMPDQLKGGGLTSVRGAGDEWTLTWNNPAADQPGRPASELSPVQEVKVKAQTGFVQVGLDVGKKIFDGLLKDMLKETWGMRFEVVVGGRVLQAEGGLHKMAENQAGFAYNAPQMWEIVKDVLGDWDFVSGMYREAIRQHRATGNLDPAAYSKGFREIYDRVMRKHGLPELESRQFLALRAGTPAFNYEEELKKAREDKNIGLPIQHRRSLLDGFGELTPGETPRPLPRPLVPPAPVPKLALGIQLGQPSGLGVQIAKVLPKSPAADAGLLVDDVLLKVQGVSIQTIADYTGVMLEMKPGKTVKVEVLRLGSIQGLKVEILPQERSKWNAD